ncbi:MAG: hypothetical protein CL759_01065 [Chloroflexi bacterium]|nr:hypothetical protein [Chloroflexota bacterium]
MDAPHLSPQDLVLCLERSIIDSSPEVLLPEVCQGRREWDQETFEEFLGVSPEITDAGFWDKTQNRAAAYGSMKGFRELADELNKSLDPD